MPRQQRSSALNHTLVGPSAPFATPQAHKGPNGGLRLPNEEDRAAALLDLALALIDSAIEILERHIKRDEQLKRASVLMPGGSVGKHFRHVMEMYQALLLPLLAIHPITPTQWSEPLEVNYDAILPSTRRNVARSRSACTAAMKQVRADLAGWGERCTGQQATGIGGSAGLCERRDGGTAGEKAKQRERQLEREQEQDQKQEWSKQRSGGDEGKGTQGGLAEQMKRPVRLFAVTPTEQISDSSVGRELWFCCLHAIHHFSMLRTIAVHELGLKLPVEFGTAPSTILYRGDKWTPPDESSVKLVKAKL